MKIKSAIIVGMMVSLSLIAILGIIVPEKASAETWYPAPGNYYRQFFTEGTEWTKAIASPCAAHSPAHLALQSTDEMCLYNVSAGSPLEITYTQAESYPTRNWAGALNPWYIPGSPDSCIQLSDSVPVAGGATGYQEIQFELGGFANDTSETGYYTVIVAYSAEKDWNHYVLNGYQVGISNGDDTFWGDWTYSYGTGTAYGADYYNISFNGGFFTYDRLDDFFLRIVLYRQSASDDRVALNTLCVMAVPYDPGIDFRGIGTIIRPNEDGKWYWVNSSYEYYYYTMTENFTEYPSDDIRFDKLNETDAGSDGLDTIICGYNYDNSSLFGLDDLPPFWLDAQNEVKNSWFQLNVWIIARTEDAYPSVYEPKLQFYTWDISAKLPYANSFREWTVSPSWSNYSAQVETTKNYFGYYAVNSLTIMLKVEPMYQNITISQVGIMVRLFTFSSPPSEWPTPPPIILPTEDIQIDIEGLVWLFIIFIPGIIIGDRIPYGSLLGVAFMGIIIGLSAPSLWPYTFLILGIVGAVFYKGE